MQSNIRDIITDAIIERPQAVRIGPRRFYLYPSTLGKHLMISRLVPALDINPQIMVLAPIVETLRVCETRPDVVARIVALATCKTKEECFDQDHIDGLVKYFKRQEKDDLATLLNIVLSADYTREIQEQFDVAGEHDKIKQVNRVKRDANTFVFCGRSVWGTTIDQACERYGWTYDYVVWGISYTALQMLLADYTRTIFVNDEERRQIHLPARGDEELDANNMDADDIRAALKLDN